MTFIRPQRRKREKMMVREPSQIRCQSHLKYVRGFMCAIEGRDGHVCVGKIEAHHMREGANGGIGMKPDDSTCVPLCSEGHRLFHTVGVDTFQARFKCDLVKLAADMWRSSPHRRKYELEHSAPTRALP